MRSRCSWTVRLPFPTTALRAGQTLVWHRPPWLEPAAPRAYTRAYADDALLAAIKPAGLPTLPGGGFLRKYPAERGAPGRPRGRAAAPVGARHLRAGAVRAQPGGGGPAVIGLARAAGLQALPGAERGPVRGARPPSCTRPSARCSIPGWGACMPPARTADPRTAVRGCWSGGGTARSFRWIFPRAARIRSGFTWRRWGTRCCTIRCTGVGGLPHAELPGLPGDGGYWLHAAELRFRHPLSGEEMELHAAPPPQLQTERERGRSVLLPAVDVGG